MATLSPIKGGLDTGVVNTQPQAAQTKSPGQTVRVNFSQTMREFSFKTHPDFAEGSKVDFKVQCLGTGTFVDTELTIPLSKNDQSGFMPKCDVNLPKASITSGFRLQGQMTQNDTITSWGDSLTFKPAAEGESYAGRPLSTVNITIGYGETGKPTFETSTAVDRTFKEVGSDCFSGTKECLGNVKDSASTAASSVDARFGISERASSSWASFSERLPGTPAGWTRVTEDDKKTD